MMPSDDKIAGDIIELLAERDPDVDPEELRSKLDQPLDQIYRINSLIGVDIASELTEIYDLPKLPPTKIGNRKFYVSIGGLVEYIKKILREGVGILRGSLRRKKDD